MDRLNDFKPVVNKHRAVRSCFQNHASGLVFLSRVIGVSSKLCGWGLRESRPASIRMGDVAFVDLDRQGFEWIVTASRAELDVFLDPNGSSTS